MELLLRLSKGFVVYLAVTDAYYHSRGVTTAKFGILDVEISIRDSKIERIEPKSLYIEA